MLVKIAKSDQITITDPTFIQHQPRKRFDLVKWRERQARNIKVGKFELNFQN